MADLAAKRLRITSSSAAGTVWTLQDGSAADALSDVRYDDAFLDGAQPSGTTDTRDRFYCRLLTITQSVQDGRTVEFEIVGREQWHKYGAKGIRIQSNDLVEFYATRGTVDNSVSMPSWHLNETAAGSVRVFYGHVNTISVVNSSTIHVTARDPLWKASRTVTLVRSNSRGFTVPRLVYNLDSGREHPDYLWSRKIIDTSPLTFGIGETATADARMTVGQILDDLQTEYETELETAGIKAAGVDLFDASELSALPSRKPTTISLDNARFADGVRAVMEWLPEYRIVVDHQTTQWRIVRHSTATIDSGIGTGVTWTTIVVLGNYQGLIGGVDDTSGFSATPGADGNYARVYSTTDPSVSALVQIDQVTATSLRTTTPPTSTGAWNGGVRVAPVHSEACPTRVLSVDESPSGDATLELDLQGSHSAVSIYSVHQKTEQKGASITWDLDSIPNPNGISPSWDSVFEAAWKQKDAHRVQDYGSDGAGMEVYSYTPGSPTSTLKIKFSESKHDDDHVADEWNGCSLHVWTSAGASVKSTLHTYTISDFAITSDVGDGSPGMVLTLSVSDIEADMGSALGTEVDPAGSPPAADRVVITSSRRFATTTAGWNGRWAVGRMWELSDASWGPVNGSNSLHSTICQGIRTVVVGGQGPSNFLAQGGQYGYPASGQSSLLGYNELAGGGRGAFHVWRNTVSTPQPIVGDRRGPGECGGIGWKPPRSVEMVWEETTLQVRTCRTPTAGYAGEVYERNNWQDELRLAATGWVSDAQEDDFCALANGIWESVSQSNQRGSLSLPGLAEHMVWLDLAFRARLESSRITDDEDGPILTGFWAACTAVTLDCQQQRTTYSFDADGLRNISYDRLLRLVKTPEQIDTVGWLQDLMRQSEQCQNTAPLINPTANICDNQVGLGPRTLAAGGPGGGGVIGKLQPIGGLIETALDGDQSTSGRSGTLGYQATSTVLRDHAGQYWLIRADGSLHPGTVTASLFTIDETNAQQYYGIPQQNADGVAGLLGILSGATPQTVDGPIVTTITAADAGKAELTVAYQGFVSDEYSGGQVFILDMDTENPRPGYTIDSHTAAGVITLAGTYSEDAPDVGTVCMIVHSPKPLADTTDFPSGGWPFKDSSGNWLVLDYSDQKVYRGAVGSAGIEKAGSTAAVNLSPLAPGSNITALTHHDASTIAYGASTVQAALAGHIADTDNPHETQISDLTGVNVSSLATGDILVWDGSSASEFINVTPDAFWPTLPQAIGAWSPGTNDTVNGIITALADENTDTTIGAVVAVVPSWYDGGNLTVKVQLSGQSASSGVIAMAASHRTWAATGGDGDAPSSVNSTAGNVTISESYVENDVIDASITISSGLPSAGSMFSLALFFERTDSATDTYTGKVNVYSIRVQSGRAAS